MKFVKYEMSAGYGTDKTVFAKFDDNATDDKICDIGEKIAWDYTDYFWSYVSEKEYDEADASEKEDYTEERTQKLVSNLITLNLMFLKDGHF